MGIKTVLLYASELDAQPANYTLDVTADVLAGRAITYSVAKPLTQTFFWIRAEDEAGNIKNVSIGSYTTLDQTPPVITSSAANGDPSVSVLSLTWSVTDASDKLSEVWVHVSETDPAGDSAVIYAEGTQKTLVDTTHSFTGLVENTPHFLSVLAKDQAGNVAIETKQLATRPDTTAPQIDSFLLRAPTDAEGFDKETTVVIEVSVSDVIAEAA